MGCSGCGSGATAKAVTPAPRKKKSPRGVKSVVKTAYNHAKKMASKLIASKSLRTKRMELCKACDRYESTLVQCLECGCFLNAKVLIKDSSCPLNEPKW